MSYSTMDLATSAVPGRISDDQPPVIVGIVTTAFRVQVSEPGFRRLLVPPSPVMMMSFLRPFHI